MNEAEKKRICEEPLDLRVFVDKNQAGKNLLFKNYFNHY